MGKKIVLFDLVADIRISGTNPLIDNDGFVRFIIQSTGNWARVGRRLLVFDHRPTTLKVAKANNSDDTGKNYPETEEVKKALYEVVRQPARVVVMEKADGNKTSLYINLYPAKGQNPRALLSETLYIGKHNAGFEIKENNALWSWTSESSSRSGSHWNMELVVLTNDNHRVLIESYGYVNIGHSDENLTVIGTEIRRICKTETYL